MASIKTKVKEIIVKDRKKKMALHKDQQIKYQIELNDEDRQAVTQFIYYLVWSRLKNEK